MQIHPTILTLIGNTPVVKLQHFDTGPCELFVKLENQNPGGSIKDRIALSMIEAAERAGKLTPGATIVEATAGNTGIALALVANAKGYRLLLVIPDKMSAEKIAHVKALGAEVIITRSDVTKGHPEYYQDLAETIAAQTPNAYYINQFANPANPLAHANSTIPELWEQMEGRLDAIVCGVGSGGTAGGISQFAKHHAPNLALIIADPQGSVVADYVNTGRLTNKKASWLVEGVGEDFIPSICDLSAAKQAFTISDKESFFIARELLRREGILAGSSSGTLVAAALKYCQQQTTPKRVATFICDTGNKYFSKIFNEAWLQEKGLIE